MFDPENYQLKEIEELEYSYLKKYWYFLKFAEDDILRGFRTKDDIINDWRGLYGSEEGGTSDFAVGSERIIYALLNGKIAGQPNSNPVSSDLFFEVEDAFIHIDLKSVSTTDGGDWTDPVTNKLYHENIGDYATDIFVGNNQNSYNGIISLKKSNELRGYKPNLPCYYTKENGIKKICLTYFITILSNRTTFDTELINILCMPNGLLEPHYSDRPLKAGKNPGKIRFNFKEASRFELLDDQPARGRIIYQNPDMSDYLKNKLQFQLANFTVGD